jgi:hypothetical protein
VVSSIQPCWKGIPLLQCKLTNLTGDIDILWARVIGTWDWCIHVSFQLEWLIVTTYWGAVSPVTTLFTPFHKWIGLMFHNFYRLNFLSTYFLVASKNINFNIFHVKFSSCKSFALNKPKFFTLTLPFIVHTFLYT